MIHLRARTRALGIILAACGLLLIAVGYLDYRRLENERAQMGNAYEMLVSDDLYTPRTSRLFEAVFMVSGVIGLATLGSAVVDLRQSRKR